MADSAYGRNFPILVPEDTFTRRGRPIGILPDAFRVAAQAKLPAVGTRSMLRSDQCFPRWAAIIAKPIKPMGTYLAAIVQLRDAVRAIVLAGCSKPDMGALIKPEPVPPCPGQLKGS